ncbi:hypothetical protein B5M42_015265 [Paenibacillus athensensis]|uniref:Uncharacterized protein n=1 Tax=Paenibacillus athensensis TaxID=1967502 RepID=A0A4Y8PRL0_9BACL|nr:hypothetical protein [Paenibacillus athensensis]MCD1260171.1 hypothetical protein [Paenibacillus athensensis]
MEYYEILFNIDISSIDGLLRELISNHVYGDLNSHFFDNVSKQDLQYEDVLDFSIHFLASDHATFTARSIDLDGCRLSSLTVVISFMDSIGKINCSFPFSDLWEKRQLNRTQFIMLMNFLQKLAQKYNIDEMRFGYEPVHQDDCCLFTVKSGRMDLEKMITKLSNT